MSESGVNRGLARAVICDWDSALLRTRMPRRRLWPLRYQCYRCLPRTLADGPGRPCPRTGRLVWLSECICTGVPFWLGLLVLVLVCCCCVLFFLYNELPCVRTVITGSPQVACATVCSAYLSTVCGVSTYHDRRASEKIPTGAHP